MAERKWIGPPKEPTPRAIPNGTWMQRHPTRYGWTDSVRNRVVDPLFREFDGITINTYVKHPEYDFYRSWGDVLGWNTQYRSVDVWGIKGRGDPIGKRKGNAVVKWIFAQPGHPWIAWLIWRGRIWTPDAGWQPWNDDGTGSHHDHPHITFRPGR